MRITKAFLRKQGIYNPRHIAKRFQDAPKVFIEYLPHDFGYWAQWRVVKADGEANPGGPSHEHGDKVFFCPRPSEQKELVLGDARAWAAEQFGVTEWERSVFGSSHPKGTLQRIVSKAKGEERHEDGNNN